MEVVCFVADLDLNCAVLSKHVDTLVGKLSARWDEKVATRIPGFPEAGMPVSDADVQKLGYFELKVVGGITYIKHRFSDKEAKLPEELQGKTWAPGVQPEPQEGHDQEWRPPRVPGEQGVRLGGGAGDAQPHLLEAGAS